MSARQLFHDRFPEKLHMRASTNQRQRIRCTHRAVVAALLVCACTFQHAHTQPGSIKGYLCILALCQSTSGRLRASAPATDGRSFPRGKRPGHVTSFTPVPHELQMLAYEALYTCKENIPDARLAREQT